MANTPVTSMRFPEDLKAWLQKKAQAENRSLANWVITRLYELKSADDAARAAEKKGRK